MGKVNNHFTLVNAPRVQQQANVNVLMIVIAFHKVNEMLVATMLSNSEWTFAGWTESKQNPLVLTEIHSMSPNMSANDPGRPHKNTALLAKIISIHSKEMGAGEDPIKAL